MKVRYSFIIPVFNRPEEVFELLDSMSRLQAPCSFEVILVEDGSTKDSKAPVARFSKELNIQYLQKPNTGPGDSRNFGMKKARGDYFLILDSDVVLPPDYLAEVDKALNKKFVHVFGGPDAAKESFSEIQKAINYAMTSLLTTGGIRRGKKTAGKFQARSFNMGLSREAFEASGGFGRIHPGEDPDLSLRLSALGYEASFFSRAAVYHKRRINWKKYFEQVYKFGSVRPILNQWHPHSAKMAYWFPSLFALGLILAVILVFFGWPYALYSYLLYLILVFCHAFFVNQNFKVATLSLWATLIQFFGYGFGFCRSTYYLRILNKDPQKRFPKLFFSHVQETKNSTGSPYQKE